MGTGYQLAQSQDRLDDDDVMLRQVAQHVGELHGRVDAHQQVNAQRRPPLGLNAIHRLAKPRLLCVGHFAPVLHVKAQ